MKVTNGRGFTAYIWGKACKIPVPREHRCSETQQRWPLEVSEAGGTQIFQYLQNYRRGWMLINEFLGDSTGGRGGQAPGPLSDHTPSGLRQLPQGTDTMLPPTALRRVSWVLLSCLTLLSQVQGEAALPLALGAL